MCFSATASFVASAVTGAAGIAAVRSTQDRRELPLASVPLFFALQQALEGVLWLTVPLSQDGAARPVLTGSYLLLALVFWPVFAPIAALSIEGDVWRRRVILICTAIGAGVSLYLLSILLTSSHAAVLKDGHIVYTSQPPPHPAAGVCYLIATGLGPAFSSHRSVNILSIIVLTGSVVAWVAYWDAFVSVWCFFAAAASVVILIHFQREAAEKKRQALLVR